MSCVWDYCLHLVSGSMSGRTTLVGSNSLSRRNASIMVNAEAFEHRGFVTSDANDRASFVDTSMALDPLCLNS